MKNCVRVRDSIDVPNVRCASSPELAARVLEYGTVRCALTSNSKARGGIGSELDLWRTEFSLCLPAWLL